MNDAWIVRDFERQELVERFKSRVIEIEEPPLRHFNYDLARACLKFLQDETTRPAESQADTFFFREFIPTVSEFARAKEERDVLVGTLLQWLVASITGRFQGNLTHKEIMDPRTIFRAESATTQI